MRKFIFLFSLCFWMAMSTHAQDLEWVKTHTVSSTADLPKGIYMAKIQTDAGVANRKLVKQ